MTLDPKDLFDDILYLYKAGESGSTQGGHAVPIPWGFFVNAMLATVDRPGFLSSEDKARLDSLASGGSEDTSVIDGGTF